MAQLDASSEGLTRAEAMADRADAYRLAQRLISEYDWGMYEPNPEDVLSLAQFLAGGPNELPRSLPGL